jgi:hypothetical protein
MNWNFEPDTSGLNVLFLDIDGVLQGLRSQLGLGGAPKDFRPSNLNLFDPVALGLVRLVCQQTNSKVVLSSDWRKRRMLHEFAPLKLPIIGFTPVLENGIRGEEIQAYMDSVVVNNWAIVDDSPNMLASQSKHFVQTDFKEGLTYRDYEQLREILCGNLIGRPQSLGWER